MQEYKIGLSFFKVELWSVLSKASEMSFSMTQLSSFSSNPKSGPFLLEVVTPTSRFSFQTLEYL